MRKLVFLLALALLLLPSCANRPTNLDGETETFPETAEFDPPANIYLDELAEYLGYHDCADSILCYTDPLITPADYVKASEIVGSGKDETRFISYNHYYTLEYTFAGTDYQFDHPNANYLTTADGKRTKLCPYEICREDESELCTHIDLTSESVNNAIAGDYVYFIGANECQGSPNHPYRSVGNGMDSNGKVNMLLRYSIKDHTIEKVLYLPGSCTIEYAYRGILYIVYNSTEIILFDGINMTAASVPYTAAVHNLTGCGNYLYYRGETVNHMRCDLNLENSKIFDASETSYHISTIGSYDGKLLCCSLNDARNLSLFFFDEDGERSTVTDNLPAYLNTVLAGDTVFYQKRISREAFVYTDPARKEDRTVEVDDGTLYAYSLKDKRSSAVFSEDGEGFLYDFRAYGSTVMISLIYPPNEELNPYPIVRNYILRDGELIFDGERFETNA